ncbi:MAG TPA: hypothetical protein VK174_13120 [Chitinophagales bacterium]|nr:hypothetical protein [Chitinophagales bacterium]
MKNTLLLALLLIVGNVYSQCGVYLTAEDYTNGKLTDEGISLSIPSGPGEDNAVAIITKNGRKVHMWNKIWGYKDKLSEYRIIYDRPMLIACKGAICVFAPYGPLSKSGKKVVYIRKAFGFGEITIASSPTSKEITTLADYSELWRKMDPVFVPRVKDYYSQLSSQNGDVMPVPEQIINYYNSLVPGYVEPVYQSVRIYVD